MISPSTAALGISIAKGVIKLGPRLDRLLAEKAAVNATLVLAMPDFYAGPDGVQKVEELRAYLDDTKNTSAPDLLGNDRADLERELAKNVPNNALVGDCYRRVFPERLEHATFNPQAAYVAELRKQLPSFDLSHPDNLLAAFSFAAGKDDRGIGYGARIGLLVADVVAEFGSEHTTRFVRDPGVSAAVQAVLERFARPDLEKFTDWSPLLRHALSSTLNGLLDARAELSPDTHWLTTLLDVLAAAREDPAGGDDFLVGLLQGRGYPLLISQGLSRAAETLAEDQHDAFKQLAADVLKAAAPLAKANLRFSDFFNDHWGDLLRAGLLSFERQGPVVLKNQPALVSKVVLGMMKELNEIPQSSLLNSETIVRLGDAAIAVVANQPDLLNTQVGGQPWLRAVLDSFVKTIARDGLGQSLSRQGLETIVTDAAGVLAANPGLLLPAKNAGLVRDLLGGILQAVGELPSFDAQQLATAAVSATLRAVAAHPELVESRFAPLVAEFSRRLSEAVDESSLTGVDASAIAAAAIEAALGNPALFVTAKSNFATAALDAVLHALDKDSAGLLRGDNRAAVVREVLANLLRHGKARLESLPADQMSAQLKDVIRGALGPVADQLGHGLDLRSVPFVLGGIAGAWARGELTKVEAAAPAFRELLAGLVTRSAAREIFPS